MPTHKWLHVKVVCVVEGVCGGGVILLVCVFFVYIYICVCVGFSLHLIANAC